MFLVYLDGSVETDDPYEALKLAQLFKMDSLAVGLPLLDMSADICIDQIWEKKKTGRQIKIIEIKNERVYVEVVKVGDGLSHGGGTRPLTFKYLRRDYRLVEG